MTLSKNGRKDMATSFVRINYASRQYFLLSKLKKHKFDTNEKIRLFGIGICTAFGL